jgi:hypothetical protein
MERKMCQNPRKYGNWEKYNHDNPELEVRINHPRAKQIINLDKIALIELAKRSIYFDRPIYVSVALLDISKYIMADFWYNGMKKATGDNVVLAYTNTDSLIVGIREPNAKQIFETHPDLKERFGTTPGKMKVECWLQWFKVYSPKHYDYIEANGRRATKSKGVPKSAVMVDDKYEFYSIRSKQHQVVKEKIVKEISDVDNKRVEGSDGKLYAIGYFDE